MKSSLLILSCLLATAYSQGRPSYAGTLQKGIPDLGSRFKVDSSSSTNNIADRLDVDGATSSSSTTALPQVNLGERVNSWPRENQPFWHVNADVINKHINRPQNGNNRIGDQRQFQGTNSNQLRGSFSNPSSEESSSNESSRQRISSRSSSYDYDNIRQLKSSNRSYY